MGTTKDSEKTRAKIIEAAGRLFADRGFDGVTVRDIAKKAETHLSAMNYHFRSKEALYREVVLNASRAASTSAGDQAELLAMKPKAALSLMVRESLADYQKSPSAKWQNTVLTRECWQPSEIFEEVVREFFKPELGFVAHIISRVTGQPEDSREVQFAVFALLSLTETFGLYQRLVEAVAPGLLGHDSDRNGLGSLIEKVILSAAKENS